MQIKTKVFTAGEHPDYTYSNSDVKAIAEVYNQTNYSAPWVLGHEIKSGDPAMGWVRDLEYVEEDGVGTLYAASDFNKAGEMCINGGTHENKSVSFYTPTSVFNPNPGQWSLRHIAMLGAEPPVLKDLGPIAVIEYSEAEMEEAGYVSYACACQNKPQITMESLKPVDANSTEMSDTSNLVEMVKQLISEALTKEKIKEVDTEIEEEKMETQESMSEIELLRQERDQLRAQLNTSAEANMALTVSNTVAPYYSEGVITEDILPEATLTQVLTKLSLGSTDYSEEATPVYVIERLLHALIGSKPAEPEYGETWEKTDLPAEKKVEYSDGDQLHDLAMSTATTYKLSYGQALSAVVQAQELSKRNSMNFSEALAQSTQTFTR